MSIPSGIWADAAKNSLAIPVDDETDYDLDTTEGCGCDLRMWSGYHVNDCSLMYTEPCSCGERTQAECNQECNL